MGRGNLMMALWVGAGLVQGIHFANLLFDTQFTLVVDAGTAVIPSALCLVSSLDNRPFSCRMSQLTRVVSPSR